MSIVSAGKSFGKFCNITTQKSSQKILKSSEKNTLNSTKSKILKEIKENDRRTVSATNPSVGGQSNSRLIL